MNTGIDDVAASQMYGAGNPVEKTRMVCRKNSDQRCPTVGVETCVNRKLCPGVLQYMPGVPRDNVIGLRYPIGVGQIFRERRKFFRGQF